jgi:hypothetical protein
MLTHHIFRLRVARGHLCKSSLKKKMENIRNEIIDRLAASWTESPFRSANGTF